MEKNKNTEKYFNHSHWFHSGVAPGIIFKINTKLKDFWFSVLLYSSDLIKNIYIIYLNIIGSHCQQEIHTIRLIA